MNYLAHLYFALSDAQSLTGNLMGDFTRGLEVEHLPPKITLGLKNHRSIDSFTDSHTITRQLRNLFSGQRRRVAGIILDVVFDHFLIKHWGKLHPQPLNDFLLRAYGGLLDQQNHMPSRMRTVVSRMAESNWLLGYTQLEGVVYALDRMAERRPIANALAGSHQELEDNYAAIEAGFGEFFPQLVNHVHLSEVEGWKPPLKTLGRIN